MVNQLGLPDVSEGLYRETEGLPFFLDEYLHQLRDGDIDTMPRSARNFRFDRTIGLTEAAKILIRMKQSENTLSE